MVVTLIIDLWLLPSQAKCILEDFGTLVLMSLGLCLRALTRPLP